MSGSSPYGWQSPASTPHRLRGPGASRSARALYLPDGQLSHGSGVGARICVPTGGRALHRLLLGEQPVLLLWTRAEHHAKLWVPPWGGRTRVGCGEEWAVLSEGP